jgi:hypothetical protein
VIFEFVLQESSEWYSKYKVEYGLFIDDWMILLISNYSNYLVVLSIFPIVLLLLSIGTLYFICKDQSSNFGHST